MNPNVFLAQRRLGLPSDGIWTQDLYRRIREFQMERGLLVDGQLNPDTMFALHRLAYMDPPVWQGGMQQPSKET